MRHFYLHIILSCIAFVMHAQLPILEKLPSTTLELASLTKVKLSSLQAEKLLGESAVMPTIRDSTECYVECPNPEYFVEFSGYGYYPKDNQRYYLIAKRSGKKGYDETILDDIYLVLENQQGVTSVLINRTLFERPQQKVFAITENGKLYVFSIAERSYIAQKVYDLASLDLISN